MPGSLLHRWQTSSMNFWHAIASKIWLAEMQNIKFRTPPGRQWTKILQFKAKRKTLEPLKFQGFLWSARSIWIFTTRKLRPSGRRRLCAVQAFYHRQNLGAGRIHFARAYKNSGYPWCAWAHHGRLGEILSIPAWRLSSTCAKFI